MPNEINAEYVYWVTSVMFIGHKLGMWSGRLEALCSRYNTYYGKDVKFVIFQCAIDEGRAFEDEAKIALARFHISHELYQKTEEATQTFMQTMSSLCLSCVTIDNGRPFRNVRSDNMALIHVKHECSTCLKVFARRVELERHLARKSPCSPGEKIVKKFPCICGKTFSHKSGWYRHREACKGAPPKTAEQKLEEANKKIAELKLLVHEEASASTS